MTKVTDYIPSETAVRLAYRANAVDVIPDVTEADAEFDRFLASMKADALRLYAAAYPFMVASVPEVNACADRIEKEA